MATTVDNKMLIKGETFCKDDTFINVKVDKKNGRGEHVALDLETSDIETDIKTGIEHDALHDGDYKNLEDSLYTLDDEKVEHTGGLKTVKSTTVNSKRECHLCGKTFPYPSDLKQHLVIHSKVRDCLCHVCSKTFYSPYY